MSSVKQASTDHPIHELLSERFSPYLFEPRSVERDKLLACLEAARWSASSYNEQPWTFLVAERDNTEEFEKMLACLAEANQSWAKNAGALILTVVSTKFKKNGKPNRVAEHDIGLAAASFTFQATALGLHVHQMAGIEMSKCQTAYDIPEDHKAFTAIAVGYAAQLEGDSAMAERDQAPRSRKPLSEFVFQGGWGKTL